MGQHGRPERVDEHVVAAPAPPLRALIAWYSGYRQVGVGPARHRGLPSPYLTVIFTLDEPLTIAEHPGRRQPPGIFDTLVGGLHTAPALVTHEGRQSGIQLALSPLGTGALLGVSAGELAGIDAEGLDVLGPLAREIGERLRAERNWPGRFAVLDRLLGALLPGPRVGPGARLGRRGRQAGGGWVSPEVGHAWHLLLASGGRCAIAGLARETGWSDRHLRGRFLGEIGLTPKAAARVIRFDLARRRLQAAAAPMTLADLAADYGYYDQAHLAREFRALAGCPPSAWLAEERFRNVQAMAGADQPALVS